MQSFSLDMMTTSPLPPASEVPTTYSAMIAQAELAIIANRVYQRFFLAPSGTARAAGEIAQIMKEQLNRWKANLPFYFLEPNPPEWFRGPRAVVFWKEQNLRMMMYKGFLTAHGHGEERSSHTTHLSADSGVRNCLEAAVEAVHSISGFCAESDVLNHGISWYATYFIFQAILVLGIALLQTPMDPLASTWETTMDRARSCLASLGRGSSAAMRCLSVVDQMREHNMTSNPSARQQEPTSANIQTGFLPESDQLGRSVDPALHPFMDNTPVATFLNGVNGFPSTREEYDFDYISGSLFNSEEFDNFAI